MSYQTVINILNEAAQDTLIKTVIVTDRYDRIKDIDKNKYPLLHADITNAPVNFSEAGVMVRPYQINILLHLGESTGKSKGSIDIDELNSLNAQLDSIASNFIRNIYENADKNFLEDTDILTSIPVFNNGANVWNIQLNFTVVGDEECVDCN